MHFSAGTAGLGILMGLAAAASQSASYVFSRLFVVRKREAVLPLLLSSHLIMGLMALAVLPFAWSRDVPALPAYVWPLTGAAFFYLVGQLALFRMVRRAEASRVAPLLSFKIVVLAVISTAMGRHLSPAQWTAAALCIGAAFMLNAAGGALPQNSLGWLGVACTGYSFSDICITRLVHALRPLPLLHASVLGVALSYALCGVVAAAFAPLAGGRRLLRDWPYAVPFAAFWFLAMIFLFGCFGLIGVVLGNIVQSTRGILSILIGALLARAGLVHLESAVPRGALVRRIAAAALMTVAIWLYQTGP